MLENLLDLIKQNAGSAIVNNPAIPNEHNDAAVSLAGSSIMDSLKGMLANGNVGDVASLFNQQGGGDIANHPATQQIQGNFIQNLMGKFGLNEGAASGIAASLIPMVLQKLVHQTNDPNNGNFNIQNIIGSLTGGGGQQTAGGGGLDIQGILSQFTGGGGASNSGGGGILDTLKGLMGK